MSETAQQPRLANSVRIVLEGLAVLSIGWLANTVTSQTTAIAVLSDEVKSLQGTLVSMPDLARDIATQRVELDEHARRISALENELRTKGWAR